MIEHYCQWLFRRPYTVIFITLLLVGLAASGVRFLRFTTDYRVFFSEENPQLTAFETLQNTYTKNDNIMFVLAPKSGEVFTRETLEAVVWLTEQAWQIPHSIRVDSVSNFQHTRAEEDDLIVEDLVSEPVGLSAEDLVRIKNIALNEPLLAGRLIPKESLRKTHVTGINITVQLPGKRPEAEVPEAVAFVRDLADKTRARHPEMDVYIAGIILLNNGFREAAAEDLGSLVPAMYLVILVLLGLLLRGFSGVFATFLVISCSIAATMGITGWLGLPMTGPLSTAPTIILTLAVADSVHLLTTLLHEMRVYGREKHEAIMQSLRINFQPIFLTSISTAIGFLSMNFGEVPPFRHMGNVVAIGVGIAFILSISFLPAVLSILPLRPRREKPENAHRNSYLKKHIMDRFADFTVRRQRGLMWGMLVVAAGLIAFIPRNELNDVFVEYFDHSFEFRVGTDFLTENLSGLYDIHYSLHASEAGGISDPAFLRKVDEFAQWYRQQPETEHVSAITDVFKRLNRNMHGDNPAWHRLPEQRDLAAQYLLLYEMSLPYGLDLNNRINIDKSATRLSISVKTLSSNELLALEERAQTWLRENAPPSMRTPGTSTSIMFANIGYRNIRGLLFGATMALVLISFILIFALRSLKFGIISMIPNLFPAAMAFGLWGILVGQVGLALSVVTGLTLGIIVDDTVHFLSKYQRARRTKNPEDAVRYALRSVGTALWITSLVLAAGFLILSLSHFQLNSSMGLLTAVTIVIALCVDFLFLPSLLMKIEGKTPTA
ncbi:MAG: MMPL family transporter [Gammaproteobacteria bacterium]|nr:MMPL family transporter [Gammaproteobacteria bacterium]